MKTLALALAAVLALGGCEKAVRNMYQGSRAKPLSASTQFGDGALARPLVDGTVEHARGTIAATSSGRAGDRGDGRRAAERAIGPGPVTLPLLHRGRERFEIYCAPCHSPLGDGDGIVARRGFPAPPSLHIERLRAAPDRHFYDVMTEGYGAMYAYADRLDPEERWAVVAYIRALQLSQNPAGGTTPRHTAQAAR